MDHEQEAIELFKALPEESQKRVCERLEQEELEETSRQFAALPKEEQDGIHDSLTDLFTHLEAEWRANPDNAGKPFSYRALWDEFAEKMKTGDKGRS